MATPQRSDRTLELRRIAHAARRGRLRADAAVPLDDIPEREELTRPGLVATLPDVPRSLPQQIGDSWAGLPLWVRVVLVLAPTVPPIVVALVQLVSALR